MPSRLHLERLGRVLAALLLIAALAPVALPFAGPDFPQGHDATAHLTNMYRFDRAFGQGQIPVRWVEGIRYGRGQPLFNFYQVGFYYFVELLHQFGLRLTVAYKAAPVLLWWLGAAFMYLLLRPYGTAAAVGGTLAFALSPYLIVDVFVRAAYPECAAIVFAIGTLWAADSFLRAGSRWRLALASLFCALMLICHLPATLIATPMIAAHTVYRAASVPDARARMRWLLAAFVVGAGLATFYLLPALAELPLIGIHRLTEDGSDFHRHFVPLLQQMHHAWTYDWNYRGSSITDPADLMPARVDLVQWLSMLAAVCVVLAALVRRRRDATIRGLLTWLGVASLSLFMMSAVSVRVWELLPPLAFIQFPWRFFLLLSIAGGVLVAMLVSMLKRRTARIVVLLLVVGVQLHLYERRLRPDRYIPRAEMDIDIEGWAQTTAGQRVGFVELAYDPVGVSNNEPVYTRSTVVSGSADVRLVRADDAWLILAVNSAGSSVVRVNTPAFPGWRVRLDGVDVTGRREAVSGYMLADVPPGAHLLEARFESTPVRQAANVMSLVSLLLLLPMVVFGYRANAVRPVAQHPSLDFARESIWRRVLRE
jgi:hypothetical protein